MTSYQHAPATKMLATRCAVCSRKLLDAKSVELGIGPDCRKHYGFDLAGIPEETRKEANAIVHKIALIQKGEEALELCKALHALGFDVLANRITQRLTKIHLLVEGEQLIVSTPYNGSFVDLARYIPGRTWDKTRKVSVFPATVAVRAQLNAALSKCFAGEWAVGPRGPFVIAAA